MQTPQGERRSTQGKSLQVVYVGDETRGEAIAEELSAGAVTSVRRGAKALRHLETTGIDCVVAESDLGDVDGTKLLGAVGELYPATARVLLADSVDDAPPNVAFVPTCPAAGLPARTARRVGHAVERRSVERERDRLADRFDSLVEDSPDPILTIDEERTLVFANAAIERVFGLGPEDVVGESAEVLLGEAAHDCFEEAVEDLIADEGTVERDYVELPGEHRDGHEIPLAISFQEFERDGTHFFSAIVRDVSERKRLEENLEAEKRKTRELHEVAVMLEECETADEVCRLAVETAEQLLEFDLCAVDAVEDGELVPQAVSKGVPSDGYYTTTPLDAEGNLAARAYRRGESLRTGDLHEENVDPAASGYRAALSVPMGDIGVFQAVSQETDAFEESDRELAELLVSHVTQALQRIQSETALKAEKRKTRELHEVAVMLEECETADEVCRLAVETAEQLLEFDRCVLDLLEDGEHVPQAVSEGLPSDDYYTTTPVDADDNLAARAFRQDRTIRTGDLHEEGVEPAVDEYRAALTVPVGDVGVFQAVAKEVGAFDESDAELTELLVSHVTQALQRIQSETALEAERDRFAALFENIPEPTVDYELDGDNCVIQSVNPAFEDVLGYDPDEVVGETLEELVVPEEDRDESRRFVQLARQGEYIDAEVQRETADGMREFLLRNAEMYGSGDEGYLIYTDITERKNREEMLDALHIATGDLMAAGSQHDICETAVDTAREVLDVPHATVFQWDDEAELLEPYVLPDDTVAEIGDAPTFEAGEGVVGSVFETGESAHFDDVWADSRALDEGNEDIKAFGAFPLGDWGVMTVASRFVGAFDDYEIDLARVLAANAEVALDRAAREAKLAEQRSQLAELDRINEVIRDVDQLLVRASTREEIAQSVCDRLADSEHYRFAWTGETMTGGKRAKPTAWAGVEEGYLEDIVEMRDETPKGPAEQAIESGGVKVVQNVHEDDAFEPWREEALERGYRSVANIPLRYRETVYGVLCVYADRPNAFDAREQAVLAELGETIGHAINAVENKKALISDGVVEVEFEGKDGEGFFARVPREEDCRFTLEGVTMTADGSFVYFMTVEELDPGCVLARADDAHDVEQARLVNEHDDGNLFEFVYTGPSPLRELTEHGGTLKHAEFTPDGGRTIVELPQNVNVRSAVESIQEEMPGSEVVARRERERPVRTVEEFRTALEGDLTDRQRSALEAAFYAGFFEWPRESNGEEVSESLGVSAPTFHQHLRVGERKLLSAFLDEQ
jgi:PAS domain S-box-containing protein